MATVSGDAAPTAPPLVPFKLSTSYEALRKGVALSCMVSRSSEAVGDAITVGAQGTSTLVLALGLAVALFLATRPHLIVPAILLLLLRYCVWSYLYRVSAGATPQVLDAEWQRLALKPAVSAAAAAEAAAQQQAAQQQQQQQKKKGGAVVLSALQYVNPLQLVKLVGNLAGGSSSSGDNRGGEEEHPDLRALQKVLMPHVRSAMSLLGLDLASGDPAEAAQALSQAQHSSLSTVETAQRAFEVLSWSDPDSYGASRGVLLTLALGVLATMYGPQGRLVTFFAIAVLCRNTMLGIQTRWLAGELWTRAREHKLFARFIGGKPASA